MPVSPGQVPALKANSEALTAIMGAIDKRLMAEDAGEKYRIGSRLSRRFRVAVQGVLSKWELAYLCDAYAEAGWIETDAHLEQEPGRPTLVVIEFTAPEAK